MISKTKTSPVNVIPTFTEKQSTILDEGALTFLQYLHETFEKERQRLLKKRAIPGQINPNLKFNPETTNIREREWKVGPCLNDLQDRTVEITGPVDRKMVINGLNSGANVFMADFEDSCSPTWSNIIEGQINLYDAVRRTITFENHSNNKYYRLNSSIATLMMRPRGLHLNEKNVTVHGDQISASLFDFGLFMFHNAHYLIENDSGHSNT